MNIQSPETIARVEVETRNGAAKISIDAMDSYSASHTHIPPQHDVVLKVHPIGLSAPLEFVLSNEAATELFAAGKEIAQSQGMAELQGSGAGERY
jgi:hypothetical protein